MHSTILNRIQNTIIAMKKYNLIKSGNVFSLLKGRILIITLGLFLLSSQVVKAEDYYVSTTGSGSGANAEAPASISALDTKLSNLTNKTLNVYFAAGTYNISSALTFGTVANISGANITFHTLSGNKDVTFKPTGVNYGFILFTNNVTAGNPFSFTMRNIRVEGFTGTGFNIVRAMAFYNLKFEGCNFINNSTNVRMFVAPESNSIMSFHKCNFTGNQVTVNLEFIYSAGANSPLTLQGCTFDNNSSGLSFIHNSTMPLNISSCTFTNNASLNSTFINSIGNTSHLTITESSFTNNGAGSHFIYDTGATSNVVISNSQFKSNRSTSGTYLAYSDAKMTVTNSQFSEHTVPQRLLNVTTGVLNVTGSTFTSNKPAQTLIFADGAGFVLSGSTFDGNEITTANFGIVTNDVTANSSTSIYDNYFTNNKTTGNTSSIFRNNGNTSSITNMYRNTFANNTVGGTSRSSVVEIHTGSGTPTLYNNTFSNNTSPYSISINTSNTKVVNNTIYKSGDLDIYGTNDGTIVKNNLLLGGDKINPTSSTAGSYCSYNISNGYFYAGSIPSGGGSAGGTAVNLTGYYDPNLTFYDPNKPPIHDLLLIHDPAHPILGKGNSSGVGYLVSLDQKGNLRPTAAPISIGAIDYAVNIVGYPMNETYAYRDGKGLLPMSIDFSQSLILPTNAILENLNVTISGTLVNGTLTPSPNNNYTYIFTPAADSGDPSKPDPSIFDILSTVTYTATYTDPENNSTSETNTLSIKVIDLTGNTPPGFTDEDQESCYGTMGNIQFSSAYRFITSNTIGTGITNQFVGFTTPLVGDLNGDGKPEIVALGTVALEIASSLCIINGQTGTLLHKMSLPANIPQYWHPTPSSIVLVDADENGLGEIIIAYPGGTGTYEGHLLSYEITSATDFTLKQKWKSNTKYATVSPFIKPVPQVLNFDGSPDPDILVYNKIYNARTGELRMTLETLANNNNAGTAYVGRDLGARNRDDQISFHYTYDMNWDGKYDVVAGGKIYYDLDFDAVTTPASSQSGTFKMVQMTNVPDGRTGVADINGDGIPDVVVVTRSGFSLNTDLRIVVWNPDFLYVDSDGSIKEKPEASRVPYILADKTVKITGAAHGNNSYVYIGDIDGRKDHKTGKMLPEIAVLAGTLETSSVSIHPNVASDFPSISGTIPTTDGVLFAVTWDDDPNIADTDTASKLKLSFIMEHADDSGNTGFTMFDFDNDGMQEICYRDQRTLRIIKAKTPYVYAADTKENRPDVILFKEDVQSGTGFEYPTIADIDGDNSAEMVVMGGDYYPGYIYAVGNNGDKFAPALPVWNQFMYSPFKINENLTVPKTPAPDPLQYKYKRTRVKADGSTEVIDFQPFNGTLIQASRYMEIDAPEGTLYEPIIFFTDGYIADARIDGSAIKFKVGNRDYAKTSISTNTPIRVYKTSIVGAEWVSDKYTLSQLGVLSAIQGGQVSNELTIDTPDPYGIYYIRLGDDTENPTDASPSWSYGTNFESGGNPTLGIGPARRYLRDCIWADNEIRVAKYVLNDDAYTIQEFTNTGFADIIANDIIPLDMAPFTLDNSYIIQQPEAGYLEFESSGGSHGGVKYVHTGSVELPDGIDKFIYEISYYDTDLMNTVIRQATVYIYILQSDPNSFAACINETNYDLKLKTLPMDMANMPEVEFYWYNGSDVEIAGNPQSFYTIPTVSANMQFKVRPQIISGPYMNVNFPKGDVTFYAIPQETKMKWTGAVNTNWNNPNNWTDNDGNAVGYSPRGCVDITIPTEDGSNTAIVNYPWLYNPAFANNVHMESKAMLANTHHLTYNNASFEIKFDASERNRWVMYSAPFGKTYAGDFMLRGQDNYSIKGAVYTSLFQSNNPDNSGNVAAKHQFSIAFSKIEQELPLGTGLILYINGTKDAGNTSFIFPSPIDQYEYYYDKDWAGKTSPSPLSGTLDRIATLPVVGQRKANNRFVTELAPSPDSNGVFEMAMNNDNITDSKIIMVTNPFNAYLKVDEFLSENSAVLEQVYMVWNGAEQPGFIEYLKDRTVDDSYITTNGTTILNQVISPYQSFFVVRKSNATIPTPLKFIPEAMTQTTMSSAPYPLKLVNEANNTFRIKASVDSLTSYTAIVKSSIARQSPKLFFNDEGQKSLDIYTIIDGEAISINSTPDLSQEIAIGIRLKESGLVTLNFEGLDRIDAYDIYLKDHDNLIDLKTNGDYKIQLDRPTETKTPYFEINDRLSLVFKKRN